MNGGQKPSRSAQYNKGPRTLQPNEVVTHVPGRCYDKWGDIWRFAHEHPDDPDVPRFTQPLSEKELADRLAAHRRAHGFASR